jgi:hypothetical protein
MSNHPDPVPTGGRQTLLRFSVAGLIVLLVVAIILVLVARGALSSGGAAGTQSSPTSTPVPVVLYQADWVHHPDAWTLPPHWHLVGGHIENDGYGTQPLIVPYYVTSPNYSIQADFTVVNIPNNTKVVPAYGIVGEDGAGTLQFIGQICCIYPTGPSGPGEHGFSDIEVAHSAVAVDEQDFAIYHSTLTFAVLVQDHQLNFCPGVSCLNGLTSDTPLWPMHLVIRDVGVQLTLTRLVITSP